MTMMLFNLHQQSKPALVLLTGYSHILKTMMPRLTASECERAIGTTTVQDLRGVVANTLRSVFRHLWPFFIGSGPREQPEMPVGDIHTFQDDIFQEHELISD